MRQKLSFNESWYFHRGDIPTKTPDYKAYMYMSSKTERKQIGPASRHYKLTIDDWVGKSEYNGEVWEKVNLPHDFVITQKPTAQCNGSFGFLPKDNGWYIKSFVLEQEDREKRLTLFFEGVATECEIYLNGCIVKRNFSGYNSFEVDITDFVKFGEENRVAVHVFAKDIHEGWWYEGGGIYRNVWLEKTYPIAIDLWGVYVRPEKTEKGWDVFVQTTLRNDFYMDKDVLITGEIVDFENKTVLAFDCSATLTASALSTVTHKAFIKAPGLWSPDSPVLYTLRTRVYEGGKLRDEYHTRFGFRSFYLDAENGLFINGKKYLIKGVCGHADFGLTGKAVPDSIHRHKVRLLKEMGANGYRTSHYMQAETLMDALDENGFIVMDETRWFSTDEASIEQLTALVKRDRNRPSVFFWSVGNEEPHHISEEGRRIYRKLASVVRKLDSSRPITTAVSYDPSKATVYEECDVIGINYNWNLYDKVHEKFPQKAVFCSEGCATGTTRGWYYEDDAKHGYISAYDHDVNKSFIGRENVWKFLLQRPWLFGVYQWTSFDHRGESAWPRLCSQSGAFDMFLQKKDAFYQNLSHWSSAPMVHLLPHWNFQGLEGKPVRVVAYTNAPCCELFLNGESWGLVEVEKGGHAEWSVPFTAGRLEAVAYDSQKQVLARDIRETTGKAEKLMLKAEMQGVELNGERVALITCYAVDAQGREVPTATPFVYFHSEGNGCIVATGADVSDSEPPHSTDRRMFAGKITVLVKASKDAPSMRVYAQADNLGAGMLQLVFENQ